MPKSGLEQWHVVGPVKALSRSIADWDADSQAWTRGRQFADVAFRRDGQVETSVFHNPDGTRVVTTNRYDASGNLDESETRVGEIPGRHLWYERDATGRLTAAYESQGDARRLIETVRYGSDGVRTSVVHLPGPINGIDPGYGVEGSETFYSVPGALTQTTVCDATDRPIRVEFRDADGTALNTIEFTRDARGDVLREECRFTGDIPPPMRAALSARSDGVSATMLATLRAAFADGLFHLVAFVRDPNGRVVSSTRRHGTMSEERTEFTYDERGNVTEQTSHQDRHDIGPDEASGAIVARNHQESTSRTRFEYAYDDHSNWTERIVSSGVGPDGEMRRTNVERRRISYWTD